MKQKRVLGPLALFSVVILLIGCNREDMTMEKLTGKWKVETLQFDTDSFYTKFNEEKHHIDFWQTEKAYTATGRGVYSIDYSDPLKKDIIDTFRFDIKSDQLAITYAQTTQVKSLFRYRYKIKSFEGSELFLDRSQIDTVNANLSATRQP